MSTQNKRDHQVLQATLVVLAILAASLAAIWHLVKNEEKPLPQDTAAVLEFTAGGGRPAPSVGEQKFFEQSIALLSNEATDQGITIRLLAGYGDGSTSIFLLDYSLPPELAGLNASALGAARLQLPSEDILIHPRSTSSRGLGSEASRELLRLEWRPGTGIEEAFVGPHDTRLEINALEIYNSEQGTRDTIEGHWSFAVDLRRMDPMRELLTEGETRKDWLSFGARYEESQQYDMVELFSASISPLSLHVVLREPEGGQWEKEGSQWKNYPEPKAKVILKDGSLRHYTLSGVGGSAQDYAMTYQSGYPIILEEAAFLLLGETMVIPLN